MGMDYNKNGMQDDEDFIIMEEMENSSKTNAPATLPMIVVVIVVIIMYRVLKG